MLKRTKGRILLGLLVITGMAGTLKDSTLSQQERKFCITNLKESRNEIIKSVKVLSPAQLNFRPAADKWTITECLYHIAITETAFDNMLQTAMKQPARPEKRSTIKISDAELMQIATDRTHALKAPEALLPAKATWASPAEALEAFRSARSEHVKYIKNTTEDLRNHVTELALGPVDCYQLILFMTGHSNRHLQQIREIIANKKFPKS